MAAVRCKPASVLGDSCHPARTPLPAGKNRLDEARPALREMVLACVIDVDGMCTTVHEHAPNTY